MFLFVYFLQDAAHPPILLQVGADKEVGTGGKSVEIGDKLEEEGLEGVTLFDEPQKKVKQKLADGLYINFCLDIKKKLKLWDVQYAVIAFFQLHLFFNLTWDEKFILFYNCDQYQTVMVWYE